MGFNREHIKWFRDSAPYIDAHRGRTFVVNLPSAALASDNASNLIADIALLNALSVKIIVVLGSADEADAPSTALNLNQAVTQLIGELAYSTPDLPVKSHNTIATTGNFVTAKPLGVIDGAEQGHQGSARSVNVQAINHQLQGEAVVIVPGYAHSPTGELFVLNSEVLATDIACAMSADKLIFSVPESGLAQAGHTINEIDLSRDDRPTIDQHDQLLSLAEQACANDVERCHVISFSEDGALLEELFTRDGCGTQIVGASYEQIRPASSEDVNGILKLIAPLEEKGVLVKRSRERLESEVQNFTVIERDGLIVACAALYSYNESAELACVVTHPDYRNSDRGERLLDTICEQAQSKHHSELFVLTTQSEDWFIERGFVSSSVDQLPEEKQSLYNYQRNSKVLTKTLT